MIEQIPNFFAGYEIFVVMFAFFIFTYQSALFFYVGRGFGRIYMKLINYAIYVIAIIFGWVLYGVGVGYIPLLVVLFLPKVVRFLTNITIALYYFIKLIMLLYGVFGDVSKKLARITIHYNVAYPTVKRIYQNNLTIKDTVEELVESGYIDAEVEEVLDEIES